MNSELRYTLCFGVRLFLIPKVLLRKLVLVLVSHFFSFGRFPVFSLSSDLILLSLSVSSTIRLIAV